MDKNIGKKLDGRYEITELIGVGGMADVYKAADILEGKTVAVKILKSEFLNNDDFLRRFRNESKAIAVLSHPNIVKIYDVGFTERIQFIVMEYIDGITLKEFIEQQGVLKWKDSVHFITQILRALQHAHDRGIVHRDVKPQNIMLFPDGSIKVMDFGIARFAREEDRTISDKAIGSVHYISPEQARGDITDEKSDIYSIGVMLYEMLTGIKPFDGDNPVSVALMHMQNDAEPPRYHNDSIPEGLEEIVIRAMQREPSGRYQSASEMIKDIDEFKKNPSIVFEYTYISGKTQYYNTGAVSRAAAAYASSMPAKDAERSLEMKKQKPVLTRNQPDYDDDYDDGYDYDDDYGGGYDVYDPYDGETVSKSSYFVVVLTAVAAVVIILVVGFIAYMIYVWIRVDPPPPAIMPDLTGRNFTVARSEFGTRFDLTVERQEYHNDYPEGAIISHHPLPGAHYRESTTNLTVVRAVVSRGPRMATVPNTYNLEVNTATRVLQSEGFRVKVFLVFDENVPEDAVIRTEPERSLEVLHGSEVALYVSMGESEPDVIVPNLVGSTIVAARALTDGVLFIQAEEVDDLAPAGTVIAQSLPHQQPNGDYTIVRKGTMIVLTVSTGNPTELTARITFSLPSNVEGRATFNAYFNGVIVGTTSIDNLAFANHVNVDISGNGIQMIILEADNRRGKTAQIGTYTVDYTVAPPNVMQSSFDRRAFESVFSNVSVTTPTTDPFDFFTDPFDTGWSVTLPDDEDWWNSILSGF